MQADGLVTGRFKEERDEEKPATQQTKGVAGVCRNTKREQEIGDINLQSKIDVRNADAFKISTVSFSTI
jgi:hypothetical protein